MHASLTTFTNRILQGAAASLIVLALAGCSTTKDRMTTGSVPKLTPVVAGQLTDVAPRVTDVAGRQEQSRHHQFLDRVRIRTGCVEHRNPAPAEPRDRNIVRSCTGARVS